ncbi:cysteine--tRNA ligase [Paenibacillus baekrokdamisoli]|uniref:Cysteine--tRNA ligase n=1 Tax=Paenibacillus baekrokdamisoli TaxID=1712516 RepID=A0A3G9IZI1_9BACL|nr:cysteine--tRNA ligase [Paenibacillus baekrokdamisoli]MBB3073143.1 cysteinyl-tRNA synthetase [Paenibacillus baekrokdamisoli]BBH23976.1 cysteine--tRNA ligase [Paenibacillus baekrokdamisoli]
MSLRIYNTMTREKEEFIPLESGKVKMYVCGPTVYDYIHIGNARPVIFFDVVRRYLESTGYQVEYVVNFTDVDDKLIRKAEQLDTTVPEVAERFIQAFNTNIEALGVHKATLNPRVTENIPEIISFIQELVDKDYAYENGGDVFFRTNKFTDYGKLSHQNMDELQLGIRIGVDVRKENGQDFVLWKAAKPGEIFWESPWGAGRPGWHIECSAMARKYLGETLDIHGGGHDLQFPHHECEVAQSESLSGKPLARYWMHNGYIHINNEKMSKSLGNGITVNEMIKRIKPAVIRYFMLSAHYRSPINFSDETIAQAENSIERVMNCLVNLQHRLTVAISEADEETVALRGRVEAIKEQFHAKMDDDFNTPDAITALFDLVSEANQHLQRPVVSAESLHLLINAFESFDQVLGLLPEKQSEGLLDADVDALIAERVEARITKNWARADEIRDQLAEQGIVLEDTPQGMRWRRK